MPVHQADGHYSARYPHLFDFFLALGAQTAATSLVVPVRQGDPPPPAYGPLRLPRQVTIIGLPHWSSARMVVRRFPLIVAGSLRVCLRELRRFDVVGAVVPSVVGTILISAARLQRRPVFLLVRGEKQRTVRLMMGERRARPYVAALRLMERPVRRWVAAGVPAFVAGHELVERYAAPGSRLFDLYPALSREFPLRERPRRPPSGRELSRLVTVSRLSGEKGVEDLLRALGHLRCQSKRVSLDVVGDGPERALLERVARELQIADAVQFHGFLPHGPELVRILDQADVFVLASRSEGLPHSLIEAMGRGLPAVCTAIGGIPGLLAGDRGVVVPPGHPVALSHAVAELLSDPARWSRLSAMSVQTAHAMRPEAQLNQFAELLTDVYPGLAARRRAAPLQGAGAP